MSKKVLFKLFLSNFMGGIIIIIIIFLKIYKELFLRVTEKSQTMSQHVLKRSFHVFLSTRQAIIQSASKIF